MKPSGPTRHGVPGRPLLHHVQGHDRTGFEKAPLRRSEQGSNCSVRYGSWRRVHAVAANAVQSAADNPHGPRHDLADSTLPMIRISFDFRSHWLTPGSPVV